MVQAMILSALLCYFKISILYIQAQICEYILLETILSTTLILNYNSPCTYFNAASAQGIIFALSTVIRDNKIMCYSFIFCEICKQISFQLLFFEVNEMKIFVKVEYNTIEISYESKLRDKNPMMSCMLKAYSQMRYIYYNFTCFNFLYLTVSVTCNNCFILQKLHVQY